MSQLAQLQADFQAYILDNEKGAAFKKCIVNDKKVGVTTRLGIYSNAYRLRMIEAITNVYPILKAWLGDRLFEDLVRQYIHQHPSTYRNMRWVGDQMAAHLTTNLPAHPIAAEIAGFEWVLGLAFDAEDAPILTLTNLAQITPEAWADIALQFHPSFHLLPLKWNTIPVWQALNADQTPPTATKTNQHCIVWRQHLNAFYREVDTQEHAVITFVMAGASFGDLCEHLAKTHQQDASQVAANYLVSWLNAEMLTNTLI